MHLVHNSRAAVILFLFSTFRLFHITFYHICVSNYLVIHIVCTGALLISFEDFSYNYILHNL